ncbi:MAG TPA: LysM domain-containing protein [Dehalococcoidia bacterium]|nr:LysM domain-containing protein [Dehalococcoidia bacterium]
MTPRFIFPTVALSLALLALLSACGGGGGRPTAPRGQLTDPRSVPTATPWTQPPDVTFLPDALTATPGGPEEPGDGGNTGGEVTPVECGDSYTVQSGDYPGRIAEKCGVAVQDLLDANPGIDPSNLHIGDVLKIPQ